MDNNKQLVTEIYEAYQREYNCKLPPLNIQSFTNKDFKTAAYLKSTDLLNEDPTIYINSHFYNRSIKDIEDILYHEFTHIFDSMILKDKNEYKGLMMSYSEFHAAKIELLKLISNSNKNGSPITLETNLICGQVLFTVSGFMDKSICRVEEFFNNLHEYHHSDINLLYYHLGFVAALQSLKLEYNMEYNKIPEAYISLIKDTTDALLCDIVDFDLILRNHKKLLLKVGNTLYNSTKST